jgi:hypothetical protein
MSLNPETDSPVMTNFSSGLAGLYESRFGRDTAYDMTWPHRQNYHAAYDPSRQTLGI